ncbi:tetratricopeptide repeat protein [Polynucleobacter sp. MWH-Creno-3A4]|uniref:tetratricopeptide repeat protein n=1 Tax=Polynucleobacter sp. MWH-Creno-3A4 TaxID=1855886 RepID=UPI001C0C8347|nr:tetratricopeptide repeat protein [Polynucleobacter sp. MWH-Creno-3A4]MBU3605939.1 tetratricopeptide repeat protein [Polynucleobacter sp. MWH-Creno-3A4]
MNPKNQMRIGEAVGVIQSGQFSKAENLLKEVLQSEPLNIAALEISGLVNAAQGKHAEAAKYLKQAAQINPHNFSTQYNLAKALSECNEHQASIAHHELAIKLSPNNPEAWNNYGKSLSSIKQSDRAIEAFTKALEINQQYPEAMHNLGSTLAELKQHDKAIEVFDKLIALMPDRAEVWSNKGKALYELKRYSEANAHYEKAISLKPDFADAWLSWGNVFWGLKQYDEAISCTLKAIELNPNIPLYWHNLGVNFTSLRLYKDALKAFDKVLSLDPDFPYLMGTWLHTKMLLADWSNLDHDLNILNTKIEQGKGVATPFSILGLSNSEAINHQTAKIQIEHKYPFNPSLGPIQPRQNPKIKLGYFSADYKTHAVAALIANLIESHDRNHFEVIGFSYGVADLKDPMRERLSKAFDTFIDVQDKSDLEIAALSRELGVDIAIDLGGHTADARTGIFAFRAASIQVNYLGYPGTMGANYYDYIIADKTIIPEANAQFFTEKVAYLPHTYQPNDRKREISSRQFTRSELGLPEDSFIFCCFNNNYKITPITFDSWCRILHAVESSALWLLEDNHTAAPNLQKEFAARGINPARLVFAPRIDSVEHLARHRLADLFIDTLPYNAHTTASDALWAGLPVLTLLGHTFPGKVAASLLHAIRLPELVTHSTKEFEALAIELGNHPERLNSIKQKLASNRLTSPLFDIDSFTRDIECIYQKMHQHQQRHLAPQTFSV